MSSGSPYNMSGGCNGGVWKASGGCLEGAWRVPGGFLEDVWKGSERYPQGVCPVGVRKDSRRGM